MPNNITIGNVMLHHVGCYTSKRANIAHCFLAQAIVDAAKDNLKIIISCIAQNIKTLLVTPLTASRVIVDALRGLFHFTVLY